MRLTKPPINLELAHTVVAVKRKQLEVKRAADPWGKSARHSGWVEGADGTPIWKSQLPPPGDWVTWLIMAGRGFGKTRTGAEWVRAEVMAGKRERLYLAGRTIDEVRDVMVEGPAGIIACCEAYGFSARYEVQRRRVVFGNGATARMFSAEEPDQARGPEYDGGWADEAAAWKKNGELWDNLQFGFRRRGPLGHQPQQVVTTTPKPVAVVRKILALAHLVLTRGSSYENRANLADVYYDQVIRPYEGTRLGRQELEGELLDDFEGALWTLASIDAGRIQIASPDMLAELVRKMTRIVAAVDPATTFGEEADETAITVAGVDALQELYVLDHWGGRVPPEAWASKVIHLYDHWQADTIVAESNQGGEMVRSTILNQVRGMRDRRGAAPVVKLIHAKRGKQIRADPIALLYEQGRAHHVGSFPQLEDQMVRFPVAVDNDDRVDALVHAGLELTGRPEAVVINVQRRAI